ncbi:MAG: PorT family protein [Bacteroidia bacterium]|nr:PorT family protein [Bacteroidia bacterium]
MNLKRFQTSIFTAILVVISLNANAQDQRFRIGLKFSTNLSWISPVSKNIDRVGSSLGYSYGVMADYNFQKYYALSSELLFTDLAGSIVHTDRLTYTDSMGTTSHSDVQYDYKFKYIQIPISIKFKTKQFGYWTYWAQFGFSPSFLTQATADITGKTVPFDDPTGIRVNKKVNDEYHYDNFDDKVFFMRFPLIIGAGVEYNVAGNTSLYAGLRMDNNFLNVFVADDLTQAKNNFASLNVGVFF